MTHDGYYKLREQDGRKILRLIGCLKEAIAELLAHRYEIIHEKEIDDCPLSELTYYQATTEILRNIDH